MKSIFYSWQSDSPLKENRYFIKDCVKAVIEQLNGNHPLDEAIRLDHDTAEIPGMPDIANTIFEKISNTSIFIADLTLCSESSSRKRSPNPNVLIELGYALKAIGDSRMIAVMNTAYGEPESLPFDLTHKRFPIRYRLEGSESGAIKVEKKQLVTSLYNAIQLVLLNLPEKTVEVCGPKSPPSLAYIENCIMHSNPGDDWKMLVTNRKTIAIFKKDINLQIIISNEDDGIQNDNFRESWANCHPDPNASGYWCDIYYASSYVDRNILVYVDGARALLPIPRQVGKSGKITEVLPFDYRLAQIFDSHGTLDSYLARSGLTLAI